MSKGNHYDVLGVRSSAAKLEIELAFRGRRAQYHPDKYSQADPETMAWANTKMQEVNQAYEVLSDDCKRREFDESLKLKGGTNSPPPSQNTRPTPDHDPSKPFHPSHSSAKPPQLLDFLASVRLSHADRSRLHIDPNISERMRSNVISSRDWSSRFNTGKLLMILDDTAFGGGKEGLAISESLLSFKSLFEESNDYWYRQGVQHRLEVRGATVHFSGQACKKFVHVTANTLSALCQAVNSFLDALEDWNAKLAEEGDTAAQMFMSNAHYANAELRVKWLTLAAEHGHPTAQHNLGCHYQSIDPEAAFYWLTLAANQGVAQSRQRLASELFSSIRDRH